MNQAAVIAPAPPPRAAAREESTRASAGFRWVPVRSLTARHRDRIKSHLLGLDENDRYLRFGYAAADSQVSQYVDKLDFERDEVFGVFNRKLEIVAMAHLAQSSQDSGLAGAAAVTAEFGVSVSARQRGKGIGARLFDHAVLHARNRGVEVLRIYALTQNTPMLRLARSAGATVEHQGADSEAVLRLPPDTLATHLEALVEDGASGIDYSLKRHAQQWENLLATWTGSVPPNATEASAAPDDLSDPPEKPLST